MFSGSLFSQGIQSDVSGFSAKLDVFYSGWDTSGDFLSAIQENDPSGYGLKGEASYGFNQRMEGFATYSFTNYNTSGDWDTFSHNEFGIGFRYNFGVTLSKFRPFAQAEVSTSSITIDRVFVDLGGGRSEGELQLTGYGLALGGGVRYFIKPYAALVVEGGFHWANDYDLELENNTLDVDEDQELSFWKFGVGFSWFFGKRF